MSALLEVRPPEGLGRAVTARDVHGRLREMGISCGVDSEAVARALGEVIESGQPVKGVVVARGREPEDGHDGFVELLVRPSSHEQVVRDDGSVDHRGVAGITVVKAGQILARLVPGTPGKPGTSVLGKALPAKAGAQERLDAGDNVSFNAESGEYYAEIDGVFDREGDRILVREVFTVPGDVDMTVGNIDFDGSVSIAGSVRDGFRVRATGDVTIHGGVEGCEVVSETGSVHVLQGVAGRGRCFVSAGQDVAAKYIENACVHARGDVKVAVAIMHSEISAGNAVTAIESKGAIIGGTIRAGRQVLALALGAANEPPTLLVLGISDADRETMREMDRRIVDLESAADKLQKVISEFEHAAADVAGLPPTEKEQYVALRKKLVILHYERDRACTARRIFMNQVTAEATGEVKATREVHGKVEIRIGQYRDKVDRMLPGTSFRIDPEQGRIVRNC
jgi:uncharacterized protein (DUF342 family)